VFRDGKRGRGAEGKTPFVAAARTLPCREEWIGWSAAEASARTRVILFPGTSRGNPGDSLAWNGAAESMKFILRFACSRHSAFRN